MGRTVVPPRNVLADARGYLEMFDVPVAEKNALVNTVVAEFPAEVRLGSREATIAEAYAAVMRAVIKARAVQIVGQPTDVDLTSRVGLSDAARQEGGRTQILKELRDQIRLSNEIAGVLAMGSE